MNEMGNMTGLVAPRVGAAREGWTEMKGMEGAAC